jgi:hypothetical protein
MYSVVMEDGTTGNTTRSSKRSSEIKVVFIAGFTRSGSTLLEHLLSISPGTVAVGEMAYLWDPEVRNTSYCGCGMKLDCCSFWKKILTAHDFEEDRSPEVLEFWKFFEDLVSNGGKAGDPQYRRFLNQIESTYAAISNQTQGSVIIDSSKRPIFALAAAKLPNVRLTMIHLVRDSRGCVFSWINRKARTELGEKAFMPRLPARRAAKRWLGSNLQANILRMRRGQHIFLRYEDLVAQPAVEVNKILRQIGLPQISADRDGIFHAPVSHGIWGNPDRWSGMHAIKVTKDNRWVTGLSARDFTITTLISAPLLKWYGYRLLRPRPS